MAAYMQERRTEYDALTRYGSKDATATAALEARRDELLACERTVHILTASLMCLGVDRCRLPGSSDIHRALRRLDMTGTKRAAADWGKRNPNLLFDDVV